jgi:DNA-directed RNA polymerase subunit RPC12/RpoP
MNLPVCDKCSIPMREMKTIYYCLNCGEQLKKLTNADIDRIVQEIRQKEYRAPTQFKQKSKYDSLPDVTIIDKRKH